MINDRDQELRALQDHLKAVTAELDAAKEDGSSEGGPETAIGAQTPKCKQMLCELREELVAAKEEIALKVVQVKQY
eukprot:Em0002g1303a